MMMMKILVDVVCFLTVLTALLPCESVHRKIGWSHFSNRAFVLMRRHKYSACDPHCMATLDPEHLLPGEVVSAPGHTPSFVTKPLADSTTPVTGQVDARRITAKLEGESQVRSGGGEEWANEGTPRWHSRPGSPLLDVIYRTTPEIWSRKPSTGLPGI